MMDELGFNKNQLVSYLVMSGEQLLHERWLMVFDSAITATMQSRV